MVLDYSDKKTVRGGVERKPLQQNRPRKDSSGMFALLSVAVLLVTFGAGVFTGWLLFKGRKPVVPAAVAQTPKKDEAVQPAPQQKPVAPDAPLTFYKTLPAGGKGNIGSGLNLKKPEPAGPHPAQPPAPGAAAAPAQGAAAPAAAASPAEKPQQPAAQFVVQLASYRSKAEADAAQAKLAAKGTAAYLVESHVGDKGVWYRLRVGKHLSKAEAEEIAAKSGKGAIVLSE